jgi:hypothetical protein
VTWLSAALATFRAEGTGDRPCVPSHISTRPWQRQKACSICSLASWKR